MAIIETWFEQDLKRLVKINRLDGNVFSQDNEGNLIGVELFDNGEPAVISGTVSGTVIRADGGTVAISSGTLSGNKCSVILPSAAYAVPGLISVVIKLTSGGRITTVCAVVAMCYRSSTDIAIDPGTIIPSVAALIAEIENVAATIPQDYSELSNGFDAKFPINDALIPAFTSAYYPLDSTGVTTTGKAWRADKGEVTGAQYSYTTYQVPTGYAGNVAIVYGHGWGKPYPLVCFYDSNMNFIMSAGWRGDTDYRGLPIIIPPATATIVINHRTTSTFRSGITFYALTDSIPLLKKIGSYGRTVDATIFAQFPEYKDLRNLPTNCVYSFAATVYSQLLNAPPGLNTYATILKVNGANAGQLAPGTAYNLYFCANENAFWIGFETNDALYWRLVSGSAPVAKKYLFIGDSYGDGYSHDGNNSGWCEYLAEKMGLSSSQYEARHQGGSGFSNGGFLARLNSATGTGFTDIVVLGGFNDYNSTVEGMENAISAFCARARALFPHATIHIGCVGWIKAGTGESAYQNWQEVRNEITGKVLPTYQNCNKYGAQYIAFSEYLLNDSLMTPTDGYHPGEAGNRAIAAGIVNALATGVACLPFKSVLKQ